jgi:hypothetical protein
MSRSGTDIGVPFSPSTAIIRDGIDRIMDLIPQVSFTFVVNGDPFEATLAEAVSLSPTLHESIQSNPLQISFEFSTDSFSSTDFRHFLTFARSRESLTIPHDELVSFVSICSYLGNDRLGLAFLSLLNPTQIPQSTDFASVDACASKFYLYSIDQLSLLDQQMLHRLLSSDSLAVESEDALLRVLIDLDVNRSDFFQYIEISFLSLEGLKLYLKEITFEDLCEGIWLKVISRLKGDSLDQLRARRLPFSVDSLILSHIPSSLKDFQGKKWTLMYRGSRDGFMAANFHGRCDGRPNTLTIIETTKGYIFGGYTPAMGFKQFD